MAAFVVFFVTARAQAETILIVEDEDTKRFAVRVKAELVALGFDVDTMRATDAAASRASLDEAARTAGALAALRVRPAKEGVEVWILDRVTRKTVLREVVAGTSDDEGAVAVGVVELLRASLLEVDTPAFVPAPDAPPTPVVRALLPERKTPPRPKRTSLVVAPAVMVSPGGLAPTPHVDLWGRFRAADRFALGLRLVLPTLPATVDEPEGRATVTLSSASIAGDFMLLSKQAFELHGGVGIGGTWAHMEGTAAQAFVGRGDDVFTALAFGHAGATLAVGETMRLWGDASVGLDTPAIGVGFAGRRVATWGQPVIVASLGVEVFLF